METQVLERLVEPPAPDAPFRGLIGESDAHRRVVRTCLEHARAGLRDVLLVGEPGTGKALLARAMHNASPRSGEAFLSVDCGALSADALETELFGRAHGALPGTTGKSGLLELAGSGTVFLRRVDLLPTALQPRLLHALEQRRASQIGGRDFYDLRAAIVASATPAIGAAVNDARFRPDLYERLARSKVIVPALRDRDGDIEILAQHFLAELAENEGMAAKPFAPKTMERIRKHDWRGNVRELRFTVRRAFLQGRGDQIRVSDLGINQSTNGRRVNGMRGGEIQIPAQGKTLDAIEAEAIALTLRLTGGNKSATARTLGISRPTLARKIHKYGLGNGN